MPSLQKKRVSPHCIRHTTATHLLRSGVDINTVRAWLGHVSLNTTNIYAEIDLEMKAKALAKCEIPDQTGSKKPWREDPDLIAFLRAPCSRFAYVAFRQPMPLLSLCLASWTPHNFRGHITHIMWRAT